MVINMYVDYDEESCLWCVFNNRDKAVASFACRYDAESYLDQA